MNEEHLSNLDLDALRLGELEPDREPLVRVHLEACGRCRRRLEELEQADQVFRDRFDPASLAAETLGRLETREGPRFRDRWLRMPPLVAAAAAILLVLGSLFYAREARRDEVRLKGASPRIELFFVTPSGPRPVADEPIPPSSRLSLRYDPGEMRYVRILWESGPGTVSALYPESSAPAVDLGTARAGARWLEREVVLDDKREPEWVHVVCCRQLFTHEEALQRDRPGCEVLRLEVRKR